VNLALLLRVIMNMVDDERVLMVPLHNDGILGAEIIRRQFMRPPNQSFIRVGQEFNQQQFFSEFDAVVCEVAAPHVAQQFAVVMVEVR
jgi:hypothetical protein